MSPWDHDNMLRSPIVEEAARLSRSLSLLRQPSLQPGLPLHRVLWDTQPVPEEA